ncbi:Fpg/Nei family DNA glycosylase [Litorisediminicola beolgyonensis]|uniref:Fpg/Nei family DNA glycosylase n=1 Tax=Litorisediminicola beolgyonensis TaxID=1173614 RepID=A0ABW3ZL45_9RHOB
MPELPEAEANRRRVTEHCLNRTIEAVRLGNDTTHVELPSASEREALVGRQFTETARHGKYIFAGSKTGPWIAVHLGMTGSLRPYTSGDAAPDFARITFEFEGDTRLAYRCPRKLGWVRPIDAPESFVAETGLGPDAMEIDRARFRAVIGATRGAVKSALMAQKKLAGLGNLWSDETLFRAGIAPDRTASGLDEGQLDSLYDEMRHVLGTLLDLNADYSKLPDDWLLRAREEGVDCPRCGGTITKTTVGGRSAYHCTEHQS